MEIVVSKKLYEAMFLVDSAQAADWDATIATVKDGLRRADAEIVSIRKWDDRRLVYEIGGKNRGMYILCYFRADGEKVQEVEKAVQLSERIMRVLILSTEQMTAEDIEKDTPATRAEKEAGAGEAKAQKADEDDERERSGVDEVETDVELQEPKIDDVGEFSMDDESAEPVEEDDR